MNGYERSMTRACASACSISVASSRLPRIAPRLRLGTLVKSEIAKWTPVLKPVN